MSAIAELANSLNRYFEAQRQLEQCRQRAIGDVEYYSYSYIQEASKAEAALRQALDGYIDQRLVEGTMPSEARHPVPLSAVVATVAYPVERAT